MRRVGKERDGNDRGELGMKVSEWESRTWDLAMAK